MNRRDHLKLLGTGTLAAVAGLGPSAATLREATASTQADGEPFVNHGVYRHRLGDVTVTAIQDGGTERPVDGLLSNVATAEVEAALRQAFRPVDRFPITFTALVVETPEHLVAIDTGAAGFFGANAGRLPEGLARAGIDPAKVDTVLLSHLHPDHISGLRDTSGGLVFPNATVHAPQREIDHWLDESVASRAPEAAQPFFRNARAVLGPMLGEVVRLSGEREVVPGITAIPAHGHSPGHTVFQIASGSEGLLVLGDAANDPVLFVRHPDWQPVFDMDRAMAAETRRRLLDRAAADGLMVAGYHFPFPAHGHIRREGSGFAYVPAPWRPVSG